MSFAVAKVRDAATLREFCELPLRLHPRDRYVPVPHPVIAGWYRGGIDMYVVRDGTGVVVGRTTVHRDASFDRKVGPRQLFGLTEFVDDRAVLAALLDTAAAAGAGRRLFGPVALLPNQTGGVITDGYAERGFVDSAWNPPWYPARYEQYGLRRRFPADTWICDVSAPCPFTFDDARIAAEQLVIRTGSRRRLGSQLPILRELLNASFAQLGYYTEISADQLAAQTDGLAHLLDEGLLLWLEKAGRPVAFIVAIPDISEYLMRVGGRLGPLEQGAAAADPTALPARRGARRQGDRAGRAGKRVPDAAVAGAAPQPAGRWVPGAAEHVRRAGQRRVGGAVPADGRPSVARLHLLRDAMSGRQRANHQLGASECIAERSGAIA